MGPYVQNQIQVVATAAFFDLLKFLYSIEQDDHFINVDQLEIGEPFVKETPYRLATAESSSVSLEREKQKVKMRISSFSRHEALP